MNCRRLIGFDSSVIAVFPSISSATVELAVKSASSMQKNEIVVSPVSLYIFMSSPNVKYGTKIVTIRSAPAKNAITKNAGWRIASLAVARAMVSDFMVLLVESSWMSGKRGKDRGVESHDRGPGPVESLTRWKSRSLMANGEAWQWRRRPAVRV